MNDLEKNHEISTALAACVLAADVALKGLRQENEDAAQRAIEILVDASAEVSRLWRR